MADPAEALREADIVISVTSLGGTPDLGADAVAADALLIPVDYGARVTPALAGTATSVVVDDAVQYERNRATRLRGWPPPTATLGALLLEPETRPAGRAVALHQGPAIADLVVADAVLRRARAAGLGIYLPR